MSTAGADQSPRPGGGAPGGGPVEAVARLLAERTGMEVTKGLAERLAACLDGTARTAGRPPDAHAAGLAVDPGAFDRLLDCVTVQESGFFRHPDQFAALAGEVLPALEGPVVVWSAGCANGQEAYSLAMELAASGRPDWQVLATDISAAAVARTRAGCYTTAEVAGVPPVHRRWLHPAGDLWEVDPALRARVQVEQASLTGALPAGVGRCQVVFCRNVLIYLTRQTAGSFLTRLATWLAPGGLVFLGYSETALPPTPGLRAEVVGGTHVLRAVPGPGPRDEPRGLWTTTGAEFPGRLRSPTGGPGADPPRWRPPGNRGRAGNPEPAGNRGSAANPEPPVPRVPGEPRPPAGFPATDGGGATTTVVAFRSGEQHWAVALERVQRVLAARGLLALPDPKPGVAGLLHRDGDTVPVLSALGGGQLGQVLVLDDRGTHFGLLVDEVIGIERVGGQPGPVPPGQRSPLVAGVLPGASPRLLLDVAALTGWLAP